MSEANEEPLMEEIPYFGKLKGRATKNKRSKSKVPRPMSGTMFKIWCLTYEVIKDDPMPIRGADICKVIKISTGTMHHAWNDKGITSKSVIANIVTNLPTIVKKMIDKKYYYLSEGERAELLRTAPMLTEDELEEQTKLVVKF